MNSAQISPPLHAEQSFTLAHSFAATHAPCQHEPCTNGTCPAGHVGGTDLQRTLDESHSNPTTHRPAMQAACGAASPSDAHWFCLQARRHEGGIAPLGTPSHAQQSVKILQSFSVMHSGLMPPSADPLPDAPPAPTLASAMPV